MEGYYKLRVQSFNMFFFYLLIFLIVQSTELYGAEGMGCFQRSPPGARFKETATTDILFIFFFHFVKSPIYSKLTCQFFLVKAYY